jgi:outer membrane protein assembly factor BamD
MLSLPACQEKEFDLANPENSFVIAKKPYTQGNYEIALNRLGEFKTKFPYSSLSLEAELLIANSYYELGRYGEAVVSYEQFIKLHPKHPQVAYAQFRIGLSYWEQAPKEVDREQDLSAKAITEWDKLLELHPQSEYVSQAKELSLKGRRRIAESHEFIAKFYCRQNIWHACAHRYIALAEAYNGTFPDLVKNALVEAAYALEKLAVEKNNKDIKEDANLYLKGMSAEEMRKKAAVFREEAKKL